LAADPASAVGGAGAVRGGRGEYEQSHGPPRDQRGARNRARERGRLHWRTS